MFKRLLIVFAFCALYSAPAFAGFEEGKAAYDKGNWIQAIINLRPAVEKGDPRAMVLLGNMYMDGHGVTADPTEGFGLYHQAAKLGNTDGMVAIATLYQTGNGVLINTNLAINWFGRAARLGNMEGALVYGIHLYQGSHGNSFDFRPDHEASYRWFRIVQAHAVNKALSEAGKHSAERIARTLMQDDIVRGDREAADWKAEAAAGLGPDPEDALAAQQAEEAKEKTDKEAAEKKDIKEKERPEDAVDNAPDKTPPKKKKKK